MHVITSLAHFKLFRPAYRSAFLSDFELSCSEKRRVQEAEKGSMDGEKHTFAARREWYCLGLVYPIGLLTEAPVRHLSSWT